MLVRGLRWILFGTYSLVAVECMLRGSEVIQLAIWRSIMESDYLENILKVAFRNAVNRMLIPISGTQGSKINN